MDITTIIISIVGSAIASSGAVAGLAHVLKDRWIEKVKADYATDLENLKSSLTSEQKKSKHALIAPFSLVGLTLILNLMR